MKPRAKFTLLPLMHWISVVMLAGSAALALSGFMALAAAVAAGTVLTFLLKTLAEQTAQAFMDKRPVAAVLYGLGSFAIACVTVALTAATLYATVFAEPSAIADWTLRREPVERELQRVGSLANTAQLAMADWAKDASTKAQQEGMKGGGGSCPNLPDTGGSRGPVAKWREDDSTIANSLAVELKALADVAQASTATLVALPKPTDFKAVKAGYEAANKASDDITRLTGGGNYAADTLRVLEARRISTIERLGQNVGCGDSARLTYIDRAAVALNTLAALKPMPRMQPGVDVSDRHEVLARSLLRSFNGVLAMATLGHAGSFNGDPLMQDALKKNGVVNIETLAFAISILAELSLVMTTLLMARQGRQPYTDNVVTWIDSDEQRHSDAGTGHRVARGAAKRLANVFYAEPVEAPASTGRLKPGPGNTTGLIELPEDPRLSRDREASWSLSLLQHHVSWGQREFLFIPVNGDAAPAARMARALEYQGQAQLVTNAAPDRLLDEPEVSAHLQFAHGPAWRDHRYQVFMLDPAYAQLMRLRAIGGQPGSTGAAALDGSAAPLRHVPLSHRLAQRPAARRSPFPFPN